MREIKNAKISGTMLGLEDHGIMTCMLYLDYGGSSQGFGGYGFDEYYKKIDKRLGTAWGMEFIKRVLEICDSEKWEDLKGKYVRADSEFGCVHRIGHITKDIWFDPKVDLKMLEGTI